MSKIMLINILQPEECRIAILEDGVLEELYVERTSHESYVGNIYKGRIVNIEPSIQAAFVDFGVGRNGFLHVSDVEPTYYRQLEPQRPEGRQRDDRRGPRRDDRRREEPRRPPPREDFEELPRRPEPPREEIAPPAAPAPRRGFADDLLDEFEDVPTAEVDTPFAEVVPVHEIPAVEAPIETEEPGEPHPEQSEEPAEDKPRRRSPRKKAAEKPRSRSRKKKSAAEGVSEEPPQPEPMDSAERRTDDGEDPPRKPREPEGNPDDDVIFFRRSQPTPPPRQESERPAAYPAAEPERFSPEPSTPEPQQESAPPVRKTEAEPPYEAPPRRSAEPERGRRGDRGNRGRDHGQRGRGDEGRRGGRGRSIEDDLEADLRAADVGHDRPPAPPVPPAPPLEAEEPRAEPEEVAPHSEEIQDEPAESSWEVRGEEVDDLEDDFAPRPMPRDRGEHRDRGDRADRGGRGGRSGPGDRRDRDRRGGRPGGPRPGGGRDSGRDGNGRPKPLIQDIFRRGQEVIVQVIKEHLGTKGPTLSTYISIPGRYLVLMPGLNRVGVSRKIGDDDQRRRLRDIFNELKPPRGVGFIIRTAGEDKNKKELQGDLAYLSRLWQVVVRRIRKQKSPAEIYQESDMITRHIRDTFTADIDAIIIDEPLAFEQAQEFLQIVMPKFASRIQKYEGTEPLFHKYGIEKEIEKIQQKKVPLPNGGSIVIEQTEALVAIDVNSGNFRADRNDPEETAFQINLQAAKEIARQLRLRDLAGVIVNDFIDMRDERRRKAVEKALRDAVKRDRSRIKVLRMSAFGIIEMTRQRVRTSLKRSVFTECTHCTGSGHVKTPESMSLEVIRLVQLAACREHIRRVDVTVTEAVANYLHNRKRKELSELEQKGKLTVLITGQPAAAPETLHLMCYDNNNNEVKLFVVEERRPPRR